MAAQNTNCNNIQPTENVRKNIASGYWPGGVNKMMPNCLTPFEFMKTLQKLFEMLSFTMKTGP